MWIILRMIKHKIQNQIEIDGMEEVEEENEKNQEMNGGLLTPEAER